MLGTIYIPPMQSRFSNEAHFTVVERPYILSVLCIERTRHNQDTVKGSVTIPSYHHFLLLFSPQNL